MTCSARSWFKTALFGMIVFALTVGCTVRYGDFTMLSSKNIDLSRMATFKRSPDRVKGEDSALIIIFIPTGVPNMKQALDRAIENVPGAVALVDGVLYRSWWFIIGQSSFIIEGTPLIDPSLAGHAQLQSNRMVSFFDPSTKKQELRYVDQQMYASVKKLVVEKNDKELTALLSTLR